MKVKKIQELVKQNDNVLIIFEDIGFWAVAHPHNLEKDKQGKISFCFSAWYDTESFVVAQEGFVPYMYFQDSDDIKSKFFVLSETVADFYIYLIEKSIADKTWADTLISIINTKYKKHLPKKIQQ